jgi:flagellar export protein FliJ
MARETLATLIRLAGSEVDTARRELQAVLAEEDRVNEALRTLDESLARESALAQQDPSFAGSFSLYLGHARRKRQGLEAERAALEPRIAAARDKLAEAFAIQKKYEIARDNRAAAARAEAARKETLDLDEMGLNAHRRGK